MENADYYGKSHRLVSEMGSPIQQNEDNPSKFYSHFLYKAALVAALLVILPLFPTQAPEFFNRTVLSRSWELLHLLLVGIAVSYGLFSRRNFETEKENQSKFDSAQNYVSRILQVSSVFDDEIESPSGSDENKIQTWNSQYFRGEPLLVVEQESSIPGEQRSTITNISNKPLLLPVRSLKSRVADSDALESMNESCGSSGSLSRSSSGSKDSFNRSDKIRNEEIVVVDSLDLDEKSKENVVLPSPIPWRSRSGRMEMKEEVDSVTSPYFLPTSAGEAEMDLPNPVSFRSPVSWSSRSSSTSSSPKKLSPSPSLSPESRGKDIEDSGRKKSFYVSSPPPAPPPPPPITRKSPSITSNSNPVSNGFSSDNGGMRKSFKEELKDSSRRGREDLRSRSDLGLDTLKSKAKPGTHIESSSTGKLARATRGSELVAEPRKTRENGRERMDEKMGKISKEIEVVLREKTGKKTREFDSIPVSRENPSRESPSLSAKPPFSKYQIQEMKEFSDKVFVEADDDSDSEGDEIQGSSDDEGVASNTVSGDEGLDPGEVDKKAAEFIAKFREQIRRQRIESIKRASGQLNTRTSSR